MRRMHLHPRRTHRLRYLRGTHEAVADLRQLIQRRGAAAFLRWCREPAGGQRLPVGPHRPFVPQLQQHRPASRTHFVHTAPPAIGGGEVEMGGAGLHRGGRVIHRRAFADDQRHAALGAARVIGRQRRRGRAGFAHAALHRGHDEAVGQRQAVQAEGGEQRAHPASPAAASSALVLASNRTLPASMAFATSLPSSTPH